MGKKKKSDDDDADADIGTVMTVSLFLILLTFFILLNSIAVKDERKERIAIGSLTGAFGGLPGGLSATNSGKSILPPSAPIVDEKLTLEQLLEYMKKKPMHWSGDIKTEFLGNKAIITINQNVLFTKDIFKLSPSILPFLDKLCRVINKGDYQVDIIGNTDNIPAKEKGYVSNWELSSLMAIQLVKYFVSTGSVSPKRLNACGAGSHRPVVPNDTRQSRSQNRRVEIILNYKAPTYIKRVFRKKPTGFFTYKKFDFKIF